MTQKVGIQVGVQDNASAQLTGLAGKFDNLKKQVQSSNPAIGRLNGSLRQLGAQAIGLQGPMAGLAQSLMAFGPQAAVVVAFAAGLYRIIGVMAEVRKARELTSESVESLVATTAIIGAQRRGEDPFRIQIMEAEKAKTEAENVWNRAADGLRALEARRNSIVRGGFVGMLTGLEVEIETARAASTRAGEAWAAADERVRLAEQQLNEAASLQTRRMAEEFGRLRSLQEAGAALTEAELTQMTTLEQRLNAIAQNTRSSLQERLVAQGALGKRQQEEIVNMEKIRDERMKALQVLQAQNLLTTQDQLELINLERMYLAVLNDGTKSAEERAGALGMLSGYYSRLEASEDAQILRYQQMEDSLGRFNIALEQRQNKIDQDDLTRAGELEIDYLKRTATFADLAQQSYSVLFDTIANGGGTLTRFGQGMLRMFAQLARGKAVENIAYAVENLAKAFGFAAVGNLPSATAAKAAAATHFKAAALWGAVGLGSGAVSAANGGGFSNSAVGTDTTEDRGSATIIINGGFLNMNDPRQLAEFQRALQQVSGRRVIVQGR